MKKQELTKEYMYSKIFHYCHENMNIINYYGEKNGITYSYDSGKNDFYISDIGYLHDIANDYGINKLIEIYYKLCK
jgi:hypothetical protein